MAISALAIGVNRILAASGVVSKVGIENGSPAVYPITLTGKALPAIVVNRLFERNDDGMSAVLTFTVYAKTVNDIESVGEALIDEIDGGTDFSFADLSQITFDKGGPDATGVDPDLGLLCRRIEFLVTW